MKKQCMKLTLIGLSIFYAINLKAESFGQDFTDTAKKTTLAKLMENKSINEEDLLDVEAQVEKVCQKKGCWMFLADGKNKMRVTFKDYSFFVR